MRVRSPEDEALLVLTGGATGDGRGGMASELLHPQSLAEYNREEQRLSVLVQHALDRLIVGGCDALVLTKLYPSREGAAGGESVDEGTSDPQAPLGERSRATVRLAWPTIDVAAIRRSTGLRIAADALNIFGPLHGGVVTQEVLEDVIVQARRYTTAYPHINLERYDVYDAEAREPVLGAWRARRIQNQRRETRKNRMIDIVLLAVEISQAVFPRLLGW